MFFVFTKHIGYQFEGCQLHFGYLFNEKGCHAHGGDVQHGCVGQKLYFDQLRQHGGHLGDFVVQSQDIFVPDRVPIAPFLFYVGDITRFTFGDFTVYWIKRWINGV